MSEKKYIDFEKLQSEIHKNPETDGNLRASQLLTCIINAPVVHSEWIEYTTHAYVGFDNPELIEVKE